jgi:chemotaxis-related protein WspD
MIDRAALAARRCWTQIGVWGDSSCTELPRVGHCRNCEVYSMGGRQLLDRPAPEEYIESWTDLLAQDRTESVATLTPHLVFRVGLVWLAFRATSLREVTQPSIIRSVPHRPRQILLGLVNIRGELHPCVSLHALFGEAIEAQALKTARFLVVGQGSLDWVFPADEVDGMHDVADQAIDPLPATLSHVDVVYSRGLFHAGEKTVAILDEDLLLGSLTRRIA